LPRLYFYWFASDFSYFRYPHATDSIQNFIILPRLWTFCLLRVGICCNLLRYHLLCLFISATFLLSAFLLPFLFLLFLFSFCCSSYPQVSCQLRFVFANHYYLHLRNFYKFSLFRWEKRYIVCMTGFCLFYVVCQILYLNFYVSYFRWLATHPLWISLAYGNIFIELWQSTGTMSWSVCSG